MKCRISIILILLLALAAPGCDSSDSKDSGKGPGIITTPDTGGNGNNGKPDAGGNNHGNLDPAEIPDADTESPGDDTKGPDDDAKSPGDDTQSPIPDTTDDEDTGFVFNPFDAALPDTTGPGVSGQCNNIQDLGILALGERQMQVVYDRTNNDGVRTSCRHPDAPTKPEKIFKFQLPSDGLRFEALGASNYTFEVRTAPCHDEASVKACNPEGQLKYQRMAAGVDYYLVVEDEAELDENSFDPQLSENLFRIKVTSMIGTECQPGVSECITGTTDVKICNVTGSYETTSCPTSCANDTTGGSCVGDTCQNPIPVTGQTASYKGSLAAFGNKIGSYNCAGTAPPDEGHAQEGSQPNIGQDIVFLATGLSVGQKIKVDTTQDNIPNKIVIQRGACGATKACVFEGTHRQESVTYDVQEAGNYYIIVDAFDVANGDADYQVTIE